MQDDLALLGQVLGLGDQVDEATGENVDQLDLGIADDEAACGPHRDGNLEGETEGKAARRRDLALAFHRVLHRQPACHRA